MYWRELLAEPFKGVTSDGECPKHLARCFY
jgi:hypothetical protein